MEQFDNILSTLYDWRENAEDYVIEQAKPYEAELIDMNVAQMDIAVDSDGKSFLDKYSPTTIQLKKVLGQPYLTDTGDFKRKMFGNFEHDYIATGSDDEKTEKLVRKFGHKIFGLTPENVAEFAELIKPNVQENFKNRLI